MKREAITRTILDTIVDHAIRDIAKDPQRSLRKLVDMGQTFAKGPFQKRYIGIIQRMLENGGSPYYDLVQDTVRNTDRENLRTFGVNIGWQCWTLGARQIRDTEARENFDIPWCITLQLEGASPSARTDCLRLLDEGRALGIYAYFLHCGASAEAIGLALELARKAPECAFPLFLSPELVEHWVGELSSCPNLLILLDSGSPGWQAAAALLRDARRFFGYFIRCSSEACGSEVLSGAWVQALLGHGGSMAFCLPEEHCPAGLALQLYSYVEQARNNQQYPLLLMDYYRDVLLVDEVISDSPRYLEFLADGRAVTYEDGRKQPLPDALPNLSLAAFFRTRFCRRQKNSAACARGRRPRFLFSRPTSGPAG
ncbi:hypothetical protein [Pseudoflavonifractor capillosus]|uniref:Uncharacterized protein n=1 Tax=Pseudoflavonifractor capillosus TaxID=106588 RepID=A0A921SRY4_9FIRM|nr:hypothetical protein [Pseudoflavonifractor capillosus]HJG86360.1 hypothetical protein [Pseudoflavonifractor capillosus]